MTELVVSSTPSRGQLPRPGAGPVEPMSHASLQTVFAHAPIGQIVSAMDSVVMSVNDRLAGMLGYTSTEMVGRPVRDFVPSDRRAEVRAAAEALLESGSESTEVARRRFLHRDGHQVPVSVTSALVRDELGRPQGWVSLVVDLSDEERARLDLEAAHEVSLAAAKRNRLLQTVATVANEASTLEQIAPTILSLVCTHFGWATGCLVRERPAESGGTKRAVEVLHHIGNHRTLVTAFRRAPRALAGGAARAGVHGRVIVVPLGSTGPHRLALVFPAAVDDLDDDQVEVLNLVGLESTRVMERETTAAQLRDSEARFRSVFDASPLPMGLTLGSTGTYSAVNGALCELVGREPSELIGQSATAICHPDDLVLTNPAGAAAAAAPDGRHQFELRLLHSSGDVVITQTTLAWIDGADGTPQLLAQIQDITARRTVEEILRRQAAHDSLTGLANRAQLNRTLSSLAQAGRPCIVLFVDIDGFKLINDTRGHDIGDEVLVGVAERLRSAVRPDDLVARFGGDEFIVVCTPGGTGESSGLASSMADRIERALTPAVETTTGPAEISASIGIAEGKIDPVNPQRLLRHADAAMYQAKKLGKDRRAFYDVSLHRRSLERIRTEAALRHALEDNRFTVHFQPIVNLSDQSVQGFEALVRLVNERGILVPPGEFISVAEQSGLIVPMGGWVLRQSCETIARLRRETGRPLTVSVNVAARQAARGDLGEVVLDALAEAGLPESALSLELTESALLEADQGTLDQLNLLRERGVGIALDDFGTGYSSLTYLQRLPVSCLKIDRSFVADMISGGGARAIVRSVARLAQELELGWIAEGIETAEQHRALMEIGAGLGQGYLFSRPVPGGQLSGLLAAWEHPQAS